MQHLQPNTTLQGGKYEIERVLGQGGLAQGYPTQFVYVKVDTDVHCPEQLQNGCKGQILAVLYTRDLRLLHPHHLPELFLGQVLLLTCLSDSSTNGIKLYILLVCIPFCRSRFSYQHVLRLFNCDEIMLVHIDSYLFVLKIYVSYSNGLVYLLLGRFLRFLNEPVSRNNQCFYWLRLVPKCEHTIFSFIEVCSKLPDVCICQFLECIGIEQQTCPVKSLLNFLAGFIVQLRKKLLGLTVQNNIEFFLDFHCLRPYICAKI